MKTNIFKSGPGRSSSHAANCIRGYVERIENLKIEGWALSLDKKPLVLSLSIAARFYPVTPTWHERGDVAEQFGSAFLSCGFTIDLPDHLAETFLRACQTGKKIAVLADATALASRVDPAILKKITDLTPLADENNALLAAEFTAPSPKDQADAFQPLPDKSDATAKPGDGLYRKLAKNWPGPLPAVLPKAKLRRALLAYRKKQSTVEGCVETFEHIKITGWVVKKDLKPPKLSLVIAGVVYPAEPSWVARSDIAAHYGDDFLHTGFEILIPEVVIDVFFKAIAETQPIVVSVDGIGLKSRTPWFALQQRSNSRVDAAERPSMAFSFKDIFAINARHGVEATRKDFQNLLSGQTAFPFRVSDDDAVNAHYYFELAKNSLIQRKDAEGRTFLKSCLAFEKRAEYLEMLGNGYLEQGDYETANHHYEAALNSPGRVSKWLFSNLEHCKKRLSHPHAVIKTLLAGIAHIPEISLFRDRFDEVLQEFWLKQQGVLESLVVTNNRDGLVAKMTEVSSVIYHAYLHYYGVQENPKWINSCNLKRVLIVGDFHIPQCVRYRIDQKMEQLKAAGKTVTAISWTELAHHQNDLVFHDVVLFYRVPAEVQVLKAMAQVNATGKLSLYEIDDLLFDPSYPPPLETYGGYLDLPVYLQLLKGMGSFNAAARYCRFGLASTQPLVEQLQRVVFGGRCYLHRNGLDALNTSKAKFNDLGKTSIDIFYGSGTMAHNNDFIDLVLPALTRILDQYPPVVLVIVGYLKLPSHFTARYVGRIKQTPPVKSMRAYWSMLEHADINLAVLHDDLINGCKSELKWFEAACLGIPSVLSSTANYRDVIKDGEDGLLAATCEDWYRQIKLLIDTPDLRQRIAEAARVRARNEYSVPVLAASIRAVLDAAAVAAQPEHAPQRRKLCLVNVFFPPQSIGGATRVLADNFELLRSHYADQFEITVFTSQAEHKPPYHMDSYSHGGARVYRSTIQWREHMDWHPQDEHVGQLFAEYLAAEQPDLVHFHCIQRLSSAIIEATKKAQIPYLVTVHDAWWISDYQFLVDAKNRVYPEGHPDIYEQRLLPANISAETSVERLLCLKAFLREAEKVLTVSNRFADIYRKNGIPYIEVNKNGISQTIPWQPKKTNHKQKVVCGHIGGMAEHKGYFLLKEAVESLQPTHIELLVVDHNHDESYQHKTFWGKVPVTFIGRVRQTHIVDLYQQIDVLFAPSTWPESYGLVTREAAACGCWVVASNLGGIGEDVVEGQSGFVIEPTLKAVSACLKTLDTEPKRYKGLAAPGPLRSVAEQVSELVGHYHQITGNSPAVAAHAHLEQIPEK